MTDRIKEIERLRKIMGTHPSDQPEKKTEIIEGCSKVDVKLIKDCYPVNPYRQIFEAAVATWGDDEYESSESKWEKASIESRITVVKAALSGNTLPIALEAPKFEFVINYTSRSAFDQVARLRIGGSPFSSGTRDNNKLDSSFILPSAFLEGRPLNKFRDEVEAYVKWGKDLYERIVKEGQGNWQAARCILPQGINHPYKLTINYLALRSQCMRRLKFCEQEDTVATFWAIRQALYEKFPLLAVYLRPGCDYTGKCQYAKAYSLSELFGCLFKPCGRNKYDGDYTYTTFNESCSDRETMQKQLGFKIPDANEDRPEHFKLTDKDMQLFEME